MAKTDPDVSVLQKQVTSLASDVLALQRILKSHQHLSQDGSSKTEAKVNLKASTLYLSGGSQIPGSFTEFPFSIFDNQNSPGRRGVGMQMFVEGQKGSSGEQDEMVLAVGKALNTVDSPFDFTEVNFAEVAILHQPQSLITVNGQVTTSPYAFFVGLRTPHLDNTYGPQNTVPTGKITQGNTILTDTTLNLTLGVLTGCRINLYDSAGGFLEAYVVITNSATTITINGTWKSPTGNYFYEIYAPMFLGSADRPWRRLYLDNEGGMAIRFGQGPPSGNADFGFYYGVGVPTFAANAGSFYINTAGGSGTTLYVNESGGASGWKAYGGSSSSSINGSSTGSQNTIAQSQYVLIQSSNDFANGITWTGSPSYKFG
jgi:hypothetical protein